MNAKTVTSVIACLVLLSGCASSVALTEKVITVKPEYGGELNFFLLKPDNPKAAVVLFPGGDGNLRLNDFGEIRRHQKGFPVRSREDFVERGFMVAVFNPPSGMEDLLREGERIRHAHLRPFRSGWRIHNGLSIRRSGKLPERFPSPGRRSSRGRRLRRLPRQDETNRD